MGVWNAYRRLADQYAWAWSAGIGCVSDKWADAIDYSGFVLPVAAVNVRLAVSSVPGGTRLVAAADDAYWPSPRRSSRRWRRTTPPPQNAFWPRSVAGWSPT